MEKTRRISNKLENCESLQSDGHFKDLTEFVFLRFLLTTVANKQPGTQTIKEIDSQCFKSSGIIQTL